jgi:hypothetical protein
MIGNDPVIDKFVHDYATNTIAMTCKEWAEAYGVDERTIRNWVSNFNQDIEEINAKETKVFSLNFRKLEEKVYKVLNTSLDEGDKQTAIACLPFFKPKKEQIEVNDKRETDEWIVQLDNADVSGEK